MDGWNTVTTLQIYTGETGTAIKKCTIYKYWHQSVPGNFCVDRIVIVRLAPLCLKNQSRNNLVYNVRSKKNNTKRSSNTLLHLVLFFSEQTLEPNLGSLTSVSALSS